VEGQGMNQILQTGGREGKKRDLKKGRGCRLRVMQKHAEIFPWENWVLPVVQDFCLEEIDPNLWLDKKKDIRQKTPEGS